ncbi:hypothetical protein ACGFR8_35560, partial [Streptomyces brevispora]|uniref:hypothetical protein n=1 Tax=Streptomyces brevispora TaxID=887462 RepID=UPI0037144592
DGSADLASVTLSLFIDASSMIGSYTERFTVPVPVGRLAKPVKVTWLAEDGRNFLRTMMTLAAIGVPRLQDLRKEHLDSFLTHVRPFGPNTVENQITTLKTIAVLGDRFSGNRLTFVPWPYRSARQISGLQQAAEKSNRQDLWTG